MMNFDAPDIEICDEITEIMNMPLRPPAPAFVHDHLDVYSDGTVEEEVHAEITQPYVFPATRVILDIVA